MERNERNDVSRITATVLWLLYILKSLEFIIIHARFSQCVKKRECAMEVCIIHSIYIYVCRNYMIIFLESFTRTSSYRHGGQDSLLFLQVVADELGKAQPSYVCNN